MKKFLFLLCLIILPAQAFEDCVISTDGKLTDISIEQNDIIDVYPIFTIMNEKNTLFVHPLKAGKTRFCVLKNGKHGFEILGLDIPPEVEEAELMRDLPTPPVLRE